MTKHPRRSRDPNQLAKLIVDIATGDAPRDPERQPGTPAIQARALGQQASGNRKEGGAATVESAIISVGDAAVYEGLSKPH